MKDSLYQLALRCKKISDEKMGTDRNIIPFRGVVFTDYTVKGPVDEYLEAIGELLYLATKVVVAYGVYQFTVGFRKYGRK